MRHAFREFFVPMVLIAVLLSLVFPLASNHTMVMAQQGVLLAGFIVFALFIWREVGGDERDIMHRHMSARAAYLAGSAVLIAGILRQSLAGFVDPWLVGALIVTVSVKVVGSVIIRLTR